MTTTTDGGFLFMGQQPDPYMDTAEARGFPRIYDATQPLSAADLRAIQSAPRRAPSGKPGFLQLPSGEICRCGRCLFNLHCPANGPEQVARDVEWK